jgi:hypothetical protein
VLVFALQRSPSTCIEVRAIVRATLARAFSAPPCVPTF